MTETAWIALGGNLGPREVIFERAIALLETDPRVRVTARSAWRETPPMGPAQPAFLNGVVRVETTLPPEVLLAWLHAVERACGRLRRGAPWGPRILDMDLVRYGDRRLRRPGLILPHPGLHRPFVREPLAEVGGLPP